VILDAITGILLALGLVVLLIGLAYKLLQRFAGGGPGGGRGDLPLEVLDRVALGPKQGIAVVRLGDRLVAVSVGDGGVHSVAEITGEEARGLLQQAKASSGEGSPSPAREWMSRMSDAVRSFSVASALVLSLGTLAGAPSASASPAPPGMSGPSPAALAGLVGDQSRSVRASGRTLSPGQQDGNTGAGAQEASPPGGEGEGGEFPELNIGGEDGPSIELGGTVGTVIVIGLMALIPTFVLLMTSFTRILIILHFLRQALGTQTAPPGHLMAALALILTGFVMAPTLDQVNQDAVDPWLDGEITQARMLDRAQEPFRGFMLDQTDQSDLGKFVQMSKPETAPESPEDVSLVTLVSAFVTSELRTAFQIGFALFLPFVVIDLVVASVLMSMGMFMLPPVMVSLPFKLLLFVLVDGWSLVVEGAVQSF